MYKMTFIGVRLNLKNFILLSYAVMELLRKVYQEAESPPGERVKTKKCFSMYLSFL